MIDLTLVEYGKCQQCEVKTDNNDSLVNHITKHEKDKITSLEKEIKVKVVVELSYIIYTSSKLT